MPTYKHGLRPVRRHPAGAFRRAERAMAVENRRHHAPIIDADPGAAGKGVLTGGGLGPVGPVASRRLSRSVDFSPRLAARISGQLRPIRR